MLFFRSFFGFLQRNISIILQLVTLIFSALILLYLINLFIAIQNLGLLFQKHLENTEKFNKELLKTIEANKPYFFSVLETNHVLIENVVFYTVVFVSVTVIVFLLFGNSNPPGPGGDGGSSAGSVSVSTPTSKDIPAFDPNTFDPHMPIVDLGLYPKSFFPFLTRRDIIFRIPVDQSDYFPIVKTSANYIVTILPELTRHAWVYTHALPSLHN